MPDSTAISPNRMVVRGRPFGGLDQYRVSSGERRRETHEAIGIGKFHGAMTPTTPMGS